VSDIERREGRSMHVEATLNGLRNDLAEAEQERDGLKAELLRVLPQLQGAVKDRDAAVALVREWIDGPADVSHRIAVRSASRALLARLRGQ
jgi:hypothetical protein